MIRVSLQLPAEIVPTIRKGALAELELASHGIATLCERDADPSIAEIESLYPYLDAARALVGAVGHPTGALADMTLDLTRHLWILLRVLRGQRRAESELLEDLDEPERQAARQRIRTLWELVQTIEAGD